MRGSTWSTTLSMERPGMQQLMSVKYNKIQLAKSCWSNLFFVFRFTSKAVCFVSLHYVNEIVTYSSPFPFKYKKQNRLLSDETFKWWGKAVNTFKSQCSTHLTKFPHIMLCMTSEIKTSTAKAFHQSLLTLYLREIQDMVAVAWLMFNSSHKISQLCVVHDMWK